MSEKVPYSPCPIDQLEEFPEIRFKKTGLIYQDSITEKQRVFHENPAKFRAVQAMLGAGKSAMATIEAFRHSWYYRSNFGFIIRKTIPQANISAIPDLMEVCPRWMIIGWNKTEKTLELLNQYGYHFMMNGGAEMKKGEQYDYLQEIGGTSLIIFTSFEGTDEALEKWASSNVGWYFIDQAEQANEAIYIKLNERMRRMPAARQAWFIANFRKDIPQKVGWLWRYFSEESPERRENHWYTDDMPTDANKKNLPDDYQATLKDTMHPDDYARLVSGEKDKIRMTDAVFPELSHEIHVIGHRDPPSYWYRGIGLDPGLANPTAFVEACFSPNGDVYVYNEYESDQKIVSDHAMILRNLVTDQHTFFFIDATANKRDPVTFKTVQGEYNAYGLPFALAPKEKWPGVERIKEYLKFDPKRVDPFTGEMGAPRLFISEKCIRLIEALMLYAFETRKTHTVFANKPEKFRDYKDHLVDALRFLIFGVTQPLGSKGAMPEYKSMTPASTGEGPITQLQLQFDSNGRIDPRKLLQAMKKPVKQKTDARSRVPTTYSRGITSHGGTNARLIA